MYKVVAIFHSIMTHHLKLISKITKLKVKVLKYLKGPKETNYSKKIFNDRIHYPLKVKLHNKEVIT